MHGTGQDFRFALRQLKKSPGFAAVAILTLALGIGASTIVFSVVYNGVLYPFPYRSAERLTAIGIQDLEHGERGSRGMFHLDEVAAFRKGNHTFEDILGYGMFPSMVYMRRNASEMLHGVGATPNAMEFWGVPPLLGRGFGEQDVQTGAPPVVLLNYRFWKREFQGDKGIVGKTMMLNGKSRTIIGVMPPRFQAVGSDVYMPISWTRPEPAREKFEWDVDDPIYFWATGILKRGVSFETASADIDVIARQLAPSHPDDYPKKFRVTMKSLNDVVLGGFRQTLLLLFAAVGLLLFISCSNVAGLLLARASARGKEIALRAALGASRGRLVRQLLSESLLLAGAGCLFGCVFAYVGLKGVLLTDLAPLPWEADITLNRPVLAFVVGISLLSALFCGMAPAFHVVRGDLQKRLASTGLNVGATFRYNRFRSGLVIGQVALSLLLLTCAGLVARSFFALIRVDLGVQPKRIFTAEIHFPRGRYTKAEEKTAFFQRLLPQLNSVPGVVSSTELIGLPLLFSPEGDVTIPGKQHREKWIAKIELCSEGYFETLGVHLLQGRLLTADDISAVRKVAVVNEKLATKFFGGENPIGRQIKFNVFDQLPETPHDAYFEIVGITQNSRGYDFHGDSVVPLAPELSQPEAFVPYSVSGFADRAIAMQTQVPPALLVNNVRQILWSIDHDVVLVQPNVGGGTGYSLDQIMQGLVYGKQEFAAMSFGACAALGFALAIVGLFSVMTYIVSLRTHDIGVRLALGAPRSAILRLMLNRGLRLIVVGIVIGLLASLAVTRFLAGEFHGVSATDPLTLVLVVIAVLGAGVSACVLPARRAAKVDPMVTLRYE
ncbi:MAG TPA: ABC transporter permease [Candidatus Eisenbacteria bacterium]|nr:ABC transporter permease [Candidatus Eisenbacteria bacterium]